MTRLGRRRGRARATLALLAGAGCVVVTVAACTSRPPAPAARDVAPVGESEAPSRSFFRRAIAGERFDVRVVEGETGARIPNARLHLQVGWVSWGGNFWFSVRNEPETVVVTDAAGVAHVLLVIGDGPSAAA